MLFFFLNVALVEMSHSFPRNSSFFWQIFFRLFFRIFCISLLAKTTLVWVTDVLWRIFRPSISRMHKKLYLSDVCPARARAQVANLHNDAANHSISHIPNPTKANLFFDPPYWSPSQSQSLLFYNSSFARYVGPRGGKSLEFLFPTQLNSWINSK